MRAVVRGPKPPTAETVAAAEAELPLPPDGSTTDLRVRFVETVILTPHGQATIIRRRRTVIGVPEEQANERERC